MGPEADLGGFLNPYDSRHTPIITKRDDQTLGDELAPLFCVDGRLPGAVSYGHKGPRFRQCVAASPLLNSVSCGRTPNGSPDSTARDEGHPQLFCCAVVHPTAAITCSRRRGRARDSDTPSPRETTPPGTALGEHHHPATRNPLGDLVREQLLLPWLSAHTSREITGIRIDTRPPKCTTSNAGAISKKRPFLRGRGDRTRARIPLRRGFASLPACSARRHRHPDCRSQRRIAPRAGLRCRSQRRRKGGARRHHHRVVSGGGSVAPSTVAQRVTTVLSCPRAPHDDDPGDNAALNDDPTRRGIVAAGRSRLSRIEERCRSPARQIALRNRFDQLRVAAVMVQSARDRPGPIVDEHYRRREWSWIRSATVADPPNPARRQ